MPDTTQLILVRHGETAWNAERRLQGHTDIALNAEGERQALALGRLLATEKIDAVVASDLLRASATAEAVAAHHGLTVVQDAQLRERCYGAFEGLRYEEIERRYRLEYAAWQRRDIDSVMPPGTRTAESFRAFSQRAVAALLAQAVRHRGRRLVVVAHGGVLECAYRAAQAIPLAAPRDFAVLNASVNRFEVAGDALRLTSWGEIAHLDRKLLDELS